MTEMGSLRLSAKGRAILAFHDAAEVLAHHVGQVETWCGGPGPHPIDKRMLQAEIAHLSGLVSRLRALLGDETVA